MSKQKPPSAQLAARIVDRLIKSGVLRAEKRDALIAKIAAGTMSGPDWELEIDLASERTAV